MRKTNRKNKNKKKSDSRRSFWKVALFYGYFLFFTGALIWTLLFSNLMIIKKIEFKEEVKQQKEIEAELKQLAAGKRWHFFGKNNLLVFPAKEAQRRIKQNFRLVREVKVKKEFPDKLFVLINDRKAEILWLSQGKYFLIDEQGEVFAQIKADDFSEREKQLYIFEDKSNQQCSLGERILDAETIKGYQSIKLFSEIIPELKIEQKIAVNSIHPEEMRLKTEQSWEIWISNKHSVEGQIQILKKMREKELIKEELGLEYVDLRIRNKVFYKAKSTQAKEASEEEEKLTEDAVLENSKPKEDEKKQPEVAKEQKKTTEVKLEKEKTKKEKKKKDKKKKKKD